MLCVFGALLSITSFTAMNGQQRKKKVLEAIFRGGGGEMHALGLLEAVLSIANE